ncbi:MAG: winged helix-turn-helix transcriptional regulator [Chloroflexota bacterium]|nr:winged helix-turn-helix transcriptional regulator [Chloroflexota bacterium]
MARPTWTFITNHGAVLALIGQHRQITTREIASQLGITERSVLRIIGDLEAEGYIRRFKEGRLNRYEVNQDRPLRRDDQRDIVVGELLEVLSY